MMAKKKGIIKSLVLLQVLYCNGLGMFVDGGGLKPPCRLGYAGVHVYWMMMMSPYLSIARCVTGTPAYTVCFLTTKSFYVPISVVSVYFFQGNEMMLIGN